MRYITIINNKKFEIDVDKDGRLLVNGKPREVDFRSLDESLFSMIMQDRSYELVIEERDDSVQISMHGRAYEGQVLDERAQLLLTRRTGTTAGSGELSVKAPMPGLIVAVPVQEGDAVKQGQTILVLESMKMQNELKAPRDGVVQRISVQAGQSVEQNKLLITLT
ncbi:MAG: biotin/lipoyl-containing protein [bacterium]|nr:biotin/lipoyl-containing protein [bacterium]